jgi:hypothetical protein
MVDENTGRVVSDSFRCFLYVLKNSYTIFVCGGIGIEEGTVLNAGRRKGRL